MENMLQRFSSISFLFKPPSCNRYSTSIENVEIEEPYTRRENRYF